MVQFAEKNFHEWGWNTFPENQRPRELHQYTNNNEISKGVLHKEKKMNPEKLSELCGEWKDEYWAYKQN